MLIISKGFWTTSPYGLELDEAEIKMISADDFDLKPYLSELSKSQEVVMKDTLFFDTDIWKLSASQKEVISEYLSFLDLDKEYQLLIEGHTNNLCESSYCEELSMKRAGIVREYLWSLGYQCDGISSLGYGKKRQIASNKYPNTRKKNQRVEISLFRIARI